MSTSPARPCRLLFFLSPSDRTSRRRAARFDMPLCRENVTRCVYRRLLCGGCTGTGALDVDIEGLYARRSEHVPDVSTAGYCAAVALGRAPSMFSLRYIALSSFFLSPNAHLPWRTFQCQDTSKGQSSKTTYKCLNREKPLLFADSRGRDGLGPHHAEHTPSSPI